MRALLSTPCYHYFLTEANSSLCFPYFPTFSADPKRRDDRRHAVPISLHSVLNLKKKNLRLASLISPRLLLNRNVAKTFAFLPYFPTFRAGSKRRECLRPAFPIFLHLVLNLNVWKVFALLSIFPYI